MRDLETLQEFLNGAGVDAAVFSLPPDYRAVLLAVDGLISGPSDQAPQLREDTTTALFILDALQPITDEALDGAADLADRLAESDPDVRTARRLIAAAPSIHEGK
jgi:hypothetical protein